MTTSQILPAVKQMIAEGNIELALTRLIELLESDPQYAELLQIARVNQADLYQNKAALLKATISTEDSRLVLNQITDSAYQIVGQIEKGIFSQPGQDGTPTRSQAWRYYAAGGIVALAAGILIWQFLGGGLFGSSGSDTCPDYGGKYKWKVMILPFKKTGTDTNQSPQFEIMDGLNRLIGETPGMSRQVIADINEKYNIDENYPNVSEAADIARNCDAQMIIWGRINNLGTSGYKLDVFYKLLDAGGVRMAGDTTINSLLQIKEDGELKLVADVDAVVRLLYIVLANQSRMPIAASFIQSADTVTAKMSALATPVDTAIALAMADNLVQSGKKEEAIQVYDNILGSYPAHSEARQKRGALLYEKGNYAAAARDLEVAAPKPENASTEVLRLRMEAALKSGQPDKASDDLRRLKATEKYDGTWFERKDKQVKDSLIVFQALRDKKEKMANNQPQNLKAQLDAGRANIAVGDNDRAIKNAEKALRINPKNVEAYEVKIMANVSKGDTIQARKTLETLQKQGLSAKGILDKLPPTVRLNVGEKRQ